MKRKLFIILCVILSLLTCDKDPYPGYSELGPEGVFYKVLRYADDGTSPQQGDVMRFRMGRVEMDSLVWQDSKIQVMRCDTLSKGLRTTLHKFQVGDSISIIMEPEAYNLEFGEYPNPKERVSDMRLRVISVIPENEWLAAIELDKEAKSVREQLIIERYLANREDSDEFSLKHEIWTRIISEGDSLPFNSDEELLVMYTATLLDGTIIDKRDTPEDALSYALGMQGQLILGLVAAIKHMERGQELELILPSSMAFGDDGSAGGIVLPWTPVRYVLRVDRHSDVLP